MLVLSRRVNERIILPTLGTSVEVLEVKGDRVRLGIQAPPEIKVLREELAHRMGQLSTFVGATAGLSREERHALRNAINTTSIGLALARRQLEAGMLERLDITLSKIAQSVDVLAARVEKIAGTEKRTNQSGRPQKALLVEDDHNECELLAGFFRMAGYEVATATDGADAIDYLKEHETPDVMLLDMMLPRCDGPTTINLVRRDPAFDHLKIFAVSGYTPDQVGIDSQKAGIARWFQKPLNPEALLREIRECEAVAC